MSHPIPTIWRWFEWSTTSGYHPRTSCNEKIMVRGPGVREFTPPYLFGPGHHRALAEAYAYLIVRGFPKGEIQLVDSRPPCIFCNEYQETHIPGFFGEFCRPLCHIPGCTKVTCVQAIVSGYIPSCMDHAFGSKFNIPRRPGVREEDVNPSPKAFGGTVRLREVEKMIADSISL
jgi:rhodanese-related sulfurtransferase